MELPGEGGKNVSTFLAKAMMVLLGKTFLFELVFFLRTVVTRDLNSEHSVEIYCVCMLSKSVLYYFLTSTLFEQLIAFLL